MGSVGERSARERRQARAAVVQQARPEHQQRGHDSLEHLTTSAHAARLGGHRYDRRGRRLIYRSAHLRPHHTAAPAFPFALAGSHLPTLGRDQSTFDYLTMMVEQRYTSVMRSTRSGNYYNVPLSADTTVSREISPKMSTFNSYDGFEYEAVAAAWGTTTMRRLPAVAKRRDLNAALDGVPSKDPHTFQPAFAFDLNKLVASLTKGSASSSHNSSFTSTRSTGEPMPEPMPDNSRIPMPVNPEAGAPQRRRRGALSGEEELTRPYSPPTSTGPENSIITYSLNKRKQKRLAAKALAAASVNGPNFEVAVANAGNEHQPQYVPRYVPEYQSDAAATMSRNREPSLDQQSYAL